MNCLLVTLNETANNAALREVGTIRVHYNINSETLEGSRKMFLANSKDFKVKTADGSSKLSLNADFSSPTNEIEFQASTLNWLTLYLLEGEYDVDITEKYTLEGIQFPIGTVPSGVVPVHPATVNMREFGYTALKQINGPYCNILGEITDINLYDTLSTFVNEYGKFYSNIKDFGRYYKMTRLDLLRCPNVVGTVEEYCAAMSAAIQANQPVGSRAHEVELTAHYSGVTYNDASINKILTIHFNEDGTYSISES